MRHRGILLGVMLGLLVGLGSTAVAAGGYHQDDRIGYKIRIPKKWETVPLKTDERWIVARFMSNKKYFWTDPADGLTAEHKPMMVSIAFVEEVVKKKRVEKTEDEEGGVIFEFNNPFKNYKDYLKRTYSGGGWFVSDEKEADLKGVAVTQMEIKVEKLTYTGPKRIVTWIYHLDGVDLAVQFEVLENSYDKLKSEIYGVLKSFREVDRTEGSLTPVTTGKRKWVDESKLSPKERMEHRKENEEALHLKAKNSLPEGWTTKYMGRFLVLNHADDKYAKKVVAHAEAIWKWLDKHFAYIGTGEYVARPIIRICKNRDEEMAFRSGSTGWASLEIVTHKDTSQGAMSWEFEYVNTRIFSIWFRYRDGDLYWAMPRWLKRGLEQVLGTARSKGSRVEFKADEWEREGLREAARADKLTSPKEMMMMGWEVFYKERHRSKEAAALLRFFLTGAASKSRKTKNLLETYLKNLKAVVTEMEEAEKKDKPESYKPPETEEEEEEQYKNRQSSWEKKEAELLQKTFDRTFGGWKDKDWRTFEALYFKSVD